MVDCKDAAAWLSNSMASASEATLQQNTCYYQRLTMCNEEAAIFVTEVTGMLDCYQGAVHTALALEDMFSETSAPALAASAVAAAESAAAESTAAAAESTAAAALTAAAAAAAAWKLSQFCASFQVQ